MSLCEAGVNPEALAGVVKELRREAASLQDLASNNWAKRHLVNSIGKDMGMML